jgi:purine-binding chemotaxis protein CheW
MPESVSVLLVRARGQACAIALGDVVETMRPLPVRPLADLPGFVQGMAVVRGAPVPVLDLGALLGAGAPATPGRFVSVRAGGRPAVLAVDEVRGLARLDAAALERVPEAHAARGARAGLVAAVATFDNELLVFLRAGGLLAADLWKEGR